MLDLLKDGIYGCGTLRSNRSDFPDDIKPMLKKALKTRGDAITRQCIDHKELTISAWQDNRVVVVASTNSDPTAPTTVQRKLRNGSRITVSCPQSVLLYNNFMGGVDLNDQLRGYYSVRIKGRKSYKYIWWFVFDMAVTNAYILCKNHSTLTTPSVKDFRTQLAKELIGKFNNRKRPGRPSLESPSQRICPSHFPKKCEKRRRCHLCNKKHNKRRDTTWYCTTCNVALCHTGRDDDCFLKYHNQ